MERIIVIGNYTPSGHSACNIYDTGGVSPTVMENHGSIISIIEVRKYEEGNLRNGSVKG